MKILILVLFLSTHISCILYTQHETDNLKKKYLLSYEYITKTIDMNRSEGLKYHCNSVGYSSVRFKNKLNISSREIDNDFGLVLCDYIRKNHLSEKGCGQLYATNDSIIQNLNDSLKISQGEMSKFELNSVSKILKKHISNDEKGFVVFFSKIYKNTLSAELKTFCSSYRNDREWQGASKIFYFVFDLKGEIKNVYIGKINYD